MKGGKNKMECNSCYGHCSGARSFLTREEKVQMLEDYKKELEHETKGVIERISELKK